MKRNRKIKIVFTKRKGVKRLFDLTKSESGSVIFRRVDVYKNNNWVNKARENNLRIQ